MCKFPSGLNFIDDIAPKNFNTGMLECHHCSSIHKNKVAKKIKKICNILHM